MRHEPEAVLFLREVRGPEVGPFCLCRGEDDAPGEFLALRLVCSPAAAEGAYLWASHFSAEEHVLRFVAHLVHRSAALPLTVLRTPRL